MLIMTICIVVVLISVKQIKRRTQAIRQCFFMIEKIEIYLGYQNASINEIFKSLSESKIYSELNFITIINMNIKNNVSDYVCSQNTLSSIDSLTLLDSTDKDNMKSFLSMLGKSDLEGQITNCKLYKEFFKNKLKCLEENENDKCKSISIIAIGLSLFFAIIVA